MTSPPDPSFETLYSLRWPFSIDADIIGSANEQALTERALFDVIAALGASVPAPPPSGLRAATLRAAAARRDPRTRPGADEVTFSPVDGYETAVRSLCAFVATITDWDRPAVNGFDVHGLVAHLGAVEKWFGSTLGAGAFMAPPGVSAADHLGFTGPLARSLRALAPSETVEAFVRAGSATVAALRVADLSEITSFYELTAPRGAIVVARMFELWTHEEDLRRATGQPLNPPPPSSLGLMTVLGVAALPQAVALSGSTECRTIEITLTGPGAGHWLQALDGSEGSGEPEAHLICDATEFCRVVADRCDPYELLDRPSTIVNGDRDLAELVLCCERRLASD